MSLQPFQFFNNVTNEIIFPVLNIADVTQTKTKTNVAKLDINQLAEKYSSTLTPNEEYLEYDKYKVTTDFEDFLDIFSETQKKKENKQDFTLSLSPEFKIKNIEQLANEYDYSKALVTTSNKPSEYSENSLSLSRSNAINASLALLNSPSLELNNPQGILKNYIQYFFGTVKNFNRLILESQSGVLIKTKSSSFVFNPFRLFSSSSPQLKLNDETLSSIESITTLIPAEIFVENITNSYTIFNSVTGLSPDPLFNQLKRFRPSPTFTPTPTATNLPFPYQIYNGYFNKPTYSQLPEPSYSSKPTPLPTLKKLTNIPTPELPLIFNGYFNTKSPWLNTPLPTPRVTPKVTETIIPELGVIPETIENIVDGLNTVVSSSSNALVLVSDRVGIPQNLNFYGIPLLFISILLLSAFFKIYKNIKRKINNEENIVFILHEKGISKAKINPLWKFKNLKESMFIWNNKNEIQINDMYKNIKNKKVNENQRVAEFLKKEILRNNSKHTNKKFIVFTIHNNSLCYFHLENYVHLM